MGTKTGKEVKIPCLNKNIKCLSGTVENYKSPKSIYIYITTWIEPKKENRNYNKVISLFKRNIKSLIRENNLINDKIFDKNFYIVDLDLRESGIKINKKSFMSLELNLYQNNSSLLLPLITNKDEEELIAHISKLVNDIITSDLFINNEYFNFYLTKSSKNKNNMNTNTNLKPEKPTPPPSQIIKEGQDPYPEPHTNSSFITTYCTKCGGIISGVSNSTNDKYCTCQPEIPKGWECPRCYKIHSPYSLQCDCLPKILIKNTNI